jgi:hypothetical protein
MGDHDDWRIGYARQALADLNARDALLTHPTSRIPECQPLHFLQMACEKLCKAHLCGRGVDPDLLHRSHAHIASTLPLVIRQWRAQHLGARKHEEGWMMQAIRHLSRRIELLSPAVDDGGRIPANCEYPWLNPAGRVVAPVDHLFEFELLYERAGVYLIKAVRVIADTLAQTHCAEESE